MHAGGVEAVQLPAVLQDDEAPDLSCLDHAFFQAEACRLLARAQSTQMHLVRESYGSGRRGSQRTDDASETLQAVVLSLERAR